MTSGAVITGREEPPGPPELDEPTLVARAQDGDVAAFERLVIRYEARLYRYAYSMLGNRHDAEDVLQDTLIRTWRALPSITDAGAFGGWVYRIATRRCLDVLARRRAHRTDPVDPHQLPETAAAHSRISAGPPADPASVAETRHQLDDLAHLLRRLPPDQRACWSLREVHQRSYREIAVALSIPESTVRGRLAHARKHLAQGMSSWQ